MGEMLGQPLKAIRFQLGDPQVFNTRDAGYVTDEKGEYIPTDQRPVKQVILAPLHPVVIDPDTGEEVVKDIYI